MSETCSNCGIDVDKDPIALCDECEGDSEAATLRAENERLREALEAAAKSLESIWAGRAESSPDDASDARWQVRTYAKSRADVARAALKETP